MLANIHAMVIVVNFIGLTCSNITIHKELSYNCDVGIKIFKHEKEKYELNYF